MQNNVVQPNVNEVKQCQSTRTKQKNVSFSFTSLLSSVLQLLPYIIIYLQKGGGGGGGQCMIVALKKKKGERRNKDKKKD